MDWGIWLSRNVIGKVLCKIASYSLPLPCPKVRTDVWIEKHPWHACTMLLIANRQQVISQLPTDLNPYKKKSQKHCKTNSRKISSDPGGNISVLYNLWLRKVCTHILLHSTLKNWTAKFILWKLSFKAYGVWVLFFLFFLRIQFIYLFQYIEYAQFEKSWVVLKCWRIKIKTRRIKD